MSDERALRAEIEELQSTIARLREELEQAKTRREGQLAELRRRTSEASRLRTEKTALLASLQAKRTEQRATEASLDGSLAQRRARVPSRALADAFSDFDRALMPEPTLAQIIDTPVPHYAKNQGWLDRLIAKLLVAFGKEWK